MTGKDLKSLFSESNSLSTLATEARKRTTLIGTLQTVLPTELAAAVTAADVRDDALIVTTESGAWAARLRFSEAILLDAAARAGLSVTSVSVKVSPARPSPS